MKIEHIQQGTLEWHALRSTKVGASDVPAIMGSSPWTNVKQLFNEKTGRVVVEENKFMKIGKEKEGYVRGLVCRDLETNFEPVIFISDDYVDFMASLDGISDNGQEIIEIKVVGEKTYGKILAEGIPLHYYHQMQWQIMCSGIETAYFVAYCRDSERMQLIPVIRDQPMIDIMIEKSLDFLVLLKMDKEPEDNHGLPSSWIALEQIIDTQEEKKKTCACCNEANRIIEDTKEEMVEFSQGKPLKGNKYSVLSFSRKGALDESKLKEVVRDLDAFRKPSTTIMCVKRN